MPLGEDRSSGDPSAGTGERGDAGGALHVLRGVVRGLNHGSMQYGVHGMHASLLSAFQEVFDVRSGFHVPSRRSAL
jgi:hypothetical protein